MYIILLYHIVLYCPCNVYKCRLMFPMTLMAFMSFHIVSCPFMPSWAPATATATALCCEAAVRVRAVFLSLSSERFLEGVAKGFPKCFATVFADRCFYTYHLHPRVGGQGSINIYIIWIKLVALCGPQHIYIYIYI